MNVALINPSGTASPMLYIDSDYFVLPTSDNSDGTFWKPYKDLGAAITASSTGMILNIVAGNYPLSQSNNPNNPQTSSIVIPKGKALILRALVGPVNIGFV